MTDTADFRMRYSHVAAWIDRVRSKIPTERGRELFAEICRQFIFQDGDDDDLADSVSALEATMSDSDWQSLADEMESAWFRPN